MPVRTAAAAACLAALVVGCSDSPTDPTDSEATLYDLSVEIQSIYVEGDCEDTPGNPGEFAWSVALQVANVPGGLSLFGTANFPDASGALPYSEDDPLITLSGSDVYINGIDRATLETATLQVVVVEHDPGGPDPDMNFQSAKVSLVVDPVAPRVVAVELGYGPACRVSFRFLPSVTAQSSG